MNKRAFLAIFVIILAILLGVMIFRIQTTSPAGITTRFTFDRLVIGQEVGNDDFEGSIFMPELITLEDGTYRMYYTIASPDGSEIRYANSKDGLDWEVQGVALKGSEDKKHNEYLIGGAGVVKLDNGDYRMYYRASRWWQEDSPHPLYQNFSAISKDGTTFTREPGARVSIKDFDSDSPFGIAGHGQYFQTDDGLFVGVFSANTVEDTGPSDLVMMTSEDGLKWGNFKTLYESWHDPTIIKKDGWYIMYATYLAESQGFAVSEDGLNWPDQMTPIELLGEDGDPMNEGNDGVADIGALVTADNEIWMFSNYGHPGLNIALFLPND